MKRIVSVFLILSILIGLFSSCTTDTSAKITVNGTPIDYEIYLYFEDLLKKSYKDAELDKAVKSEIARYVAINSEFENQKLSLTKSQKADLSTTVNDLWHLFGTHYAKVGVSKQTIYKIERSKAYEISLLVKYYSEDGVSPVNEDDLKAYFSDNYCAIRYVVGYLFDVDENGSNVPMSAENRNTIIETYNTVATIVNESLADDKESETVDTSLESAVGALGEGSEIHDALVNSFADGTFPTGFFAAVSNIETKKTATVVLGDYIFLVQKVDIFNGNYNYYETYRDDCLKKMKGEEFSKVINEWAKNYTVK
jgi:hypothetical protein